MSKRAERNDATQNDAVAPEVTQNDAVDQNETVPQYKTVIELMNEHLPRLEADGKCHTSELLELMYLHFPESRGTHKDVAWHRNRLRKAGVLNPVQRLTVEQRKARKAEYEKKFRERKQAERAAQVAAK